VRPAEMTTRRGGDYPIFVDAGGTSREARLDRTRDVPGPAGDAMIEPESYA